MSQTNNEKTSKTTNNDGQQKPVSRPEPPETHPFGFKPKDEFPPLPTSPF